MSKKITTKKLKAILACQPNAAARAAGFSLSAARAAGFSLSAAIAAGFSLSAARAAGFSLSEAIAAGYNVEEWERIPTLVNPYTQLLTDINEKKRVFKQSTFGDIIDFNPDLNVCKSAMCTAGHLVNMAGVVGYELRKKYEFAGAAEMIHVKAHPFYPVQNFGSIPQDHALAYIEMMAEMEKRGIETAEDIKAFMAETD